MKRVGWVLLALLLMVAPVYAQGAMLPDAIPQFLDINGNPLSSGTLSFFLTGTSTPTTVYSDSALTTPTGTAGVITLDAGGRPPTAVYLAVQPYKVVLKDSGGVTIATRDPVSGASYLGLQAATATIQTTTSTGTVNDFALSSTTAPLVILRCNNATDLTLTGFVAGTAGQRVLVQSVGAGNVFLASQTGSSAANRIITIVTSGNTPLAAGTGTAELVRDGTTARWRMFTHEQGAAIAFTPALTFGGGATGLTYTSRTGSYLLHGRALTVEIEIFLSSKGSSTGTAVIGTLPFTPTTPVTSVVDTIQGWSSITGPVFGAVSGTSMTLVQGTTTVRSVIADTNMANNTNLRLSLQAIVQ